MVLIEVGGYLFSSARVFFSGIKKSFQQAVAQNAPNGNIFQKFAGGVFGTEFATQMTQDEAKQVLGFKADEKLSRDTVRERMQQFHAMNAVDQGGSPYLNEKFTVAAHILSK